MTGIRLLLVRHGNTFESGETPRQVGARSDLLLTEHGRKQAGFFADYLISKHLTPAAIYAGALQRQTETAKIIGAALRGKPPIHLNEKALTEIDYGVWEGLTTDQIVEKWEKEYHAWTTERKWSPLFGGSEEEHLHAIEQWLTRLRDKYSPGDTVLGVTSNGTLRFFYALASHSQKIDDLKVKTGHFCELSLKENSLEIIHWNKDPKAIN